MDKDLDKDKDMDMDKDKNMNKDWKGEKNEDERKKERLSDNSPVSRVRNVWQKKTKECLYI